MRLDRIPASVAFCDIETTGLGKDDRIGAQVRAELLAVIMALLREAGF